LQTTLQEFVCGSEVRPVSRSPNGTLGDFMLALAYEDAERMTGRIGVDEQRLVRIVRTIKAELGP
jgi:hypothetical protein